jgi:hypothetical protein
MTAALSTSVPSWPLTTRLKSTLTLSRTVVELRFTQSELRLKATGFDLNNINFEDPFGEVIISIKEEDEVKEVFRLLFDIFDVIGAEDEFSGEET